MCRVLVLQGQQLNCKCELSDGFQQNLPLLPTAVTPGRLLRVVRVERGTVCGCAGAQRSGHVNLHNLAQHA